MKEWMSAWLTGCHYEGLMQSWLGSQWRDPLFKGHFNDGVKDQRGVDRQG